MRQLQFLILFLLSSFVLAQPKMTGNVTVDMENGLIDCDFSISGLPNLKDYSILLNKGMNIKYFKNKSGNLVYYEGHYDGKMKGEALEYFLADENSKMNLPNELNVSYKGVFPVYQNDFNMFDYKGIIAFNGKTLRAAEQTKWYPIIYDTTNDKLIDSYLYDITITVKGNSQPSIFINGSPPKKAQKSRFKSEKAQRPLLFIGDYNFLEKDRNFILNSDVDKETADKIFSNIEMIKKVLSKNLESDFQDKIYIINHIPINKRDKGSNWGFNTYPTFAFAGLDFKDLINKNGKFSDDNYKFFGHEFGHNYFGSNVMSGKLSWFWVESFAEYLSFNIVEELCGKDYLEKVLANKLRIVNDKNFIPLSKITNATQIDETYRYHLAPLLLKSFENQFGRQKINQVLKNLLEISKKETLTLESWEKSAQEAGISNDDFKAFKNKYIDNDNFKQKIINYIKEFHKI